VLWRYCRFCCYLDKNRHLLRHVKGRHGPRAVEINFSYTAKGPIESLPPKVRVARESLEGVKRVDEAWCLA